MSQNYLKHIFKRDNVCEALRIVIGICINVSYYYCHFNVNQEVLSLYGQQYDKNFMLLWDSD